VLAHGAAPEKSACEKRFGGLIMAEDGPILQKPLREQLAPGFAPADAIAALARDGLAIQLPLSAAMTRLHVDYQPADHACVSEHDGGYRIAIPLQVALRSEDGVLSARLGGFAETSVSREGRWETVEVQLDHAPLASLERSGFEAPEGAIALLGGSMSATASGAGNEALTLHVCKPRPNVPPYPSVADASLQRLGCFCDGAREAKTVDVGRWPSEPVHDIAAPRPSRLPSRLPLRIEPR
jgi:hypothetical protein